MATDIRDIVRQLPELRDPSGISGTSNGDAGGAITNIGNKLDSEYDTLVNLMNDISDGEVNATSGYEIGGISINRGDKTDDPGFMLRLATGTSTQQIMTGQLTDGAMKISQMAKAIAQKIG